MSTGQSGIYHAGSMSVWKTELSHLLRLGLPLAGTQLAQISVNTMDVLMIGWLSAEDLAASVLAFNYYFVLWLFGVGVVQAAMPLSAQAYGGRDLRAMRRVVRQGIWVAVIFSAIAMVALSYTAPVLTFLGQDPELVLRASAYMDILKWSFFPAIGLIALRVFLATTGYAQAILWATIFSAVMNGVLNYGLIFGHLGMPALGLVGAGIASVISSSTGLIIIVAYIVLHRKLRRYALFGRIWRADLQILQRIVRLGLPIGMTLLAEVGMFAVAALMMGWIGIQELAAHAIVAQCAAITFMVPLGLGQATVVRVGLAAGRGDSPGIGIAGWTAMASAVFFMFLAAIIFWLIPETLIGLYQDETDPLAPSVLVFGVSFMAVAAVFQIVDGAQVIGGMALRGLNDTKVVMIYALIGYWIIGLGLGYLLAFPLQMGGVGIWWGLASGLAAVAAAATLRFARRENLGLIDGFVPASP